MSTPELTSTPASSSPTPLATTPKRRTKSHFLTGGTSGVISAIAFQPADLLKTRLQQAPPSTSATATLVTTVRSIASGPRPVQSLWRGTLPSAIRTGIGSALYFSALNAVRGAVARSKFLSSSPSSSSTSTTRSSSALPQLGAVANLTAGAVTRAAVGFVMMPITVVKVRYESSLYSYTSLWAAFRDTWKSEGPRGFFSGWGATAIRDAPYAGLYVLFYEQSKKSLSHLALRDRGAGGGEMEAGTAALINTASGAGAGALATAVTNPFDALKTRIQVAPERYRNMWHALRMVAMEKDGGRWRGRALFDGLGLRMARKAVSSALVWGLYEGMIR